MTQPLDRLSELPAIGPIDREAGEFWVENPFKMPQIGENLSAYERNCVFVNVGGTSFLDVSFCSAADIDSDSRSVIPGDFDRDGAVDLLVGSVGGGPLRLFRNRFPQGAGQIRIDLTGTTSNRTAIGTRVTLHCGKRRIVRDVFAANGFMGQAPPELLIGVGDARQIDRLEVRWPTGAVQHFTDVPVNAHVAITEGQEELRRVEP